MTQQHAPDDADKLAKAHDIYQSLLKSRQSIILATNNDDGSPFSSYTPFALDNNKNFYVFVSTLAHHTQNLMRTRQASLMLIEDEASSTQIFARQRLTFSCQAEELERDSDEWQSAAKLYEARFGDFFALIRGFKDFKMFRLIPTEGQLVAGFGQAYSIHGDALDHLSLRRE